MAMSGDTMPSICSLFLPREECIAPRRLLMYIWVACLLCKLSAEVEAKLCVNANADAGVDTPKDIRIPMGVDDECDCIALIVVAILNLRRSEERAMQL
mmetsp:Transcript_3506/g.8935  ORF Transcript_3506/g.8935 Transcript_3506/m.8935 type:complete len:98 (-) Transcript_3506:15-308(-)